MPFWSSGQRLSRLSIQNSQRSPHSPGDAQCLRILDFSLRVRKELTGHTQATVLATRRVGIAPRQAASPRHMRCMPPRRARHSSARLPKLDCNCGPGAIPGTALSWSRVPPPLPFACPCGPSRALAATHRRPSTMPTDPRGCAGVDPFNSPPGKWEPWPCSLRRAVGRAFPPNRPQKAPIEGASLPFSDGFEPHALPWP